jgi:HrpA-like RNA helicase
MDFSFVSLKNLLNTKMSEGKKIPKLIIMSATLNSQEFADYFATDSSTGLFFIPEVIALEELKEEGRNRRNKPSIPQFKLT